MPLDPKGKGTIYLSYKISHLFTPYVFAHTFFFLL